MNHDVMIQIAEVFLIARDHDDPHLVTALVERGIDVEIAERCVAFLPIAFGRVILERIGSVKFSDVYIIQESEMQFPLSDEPIFCEASALARESYQTGLIRREVFSAIAARSSELDAVSKALNKGAKIDGSIMSPAVLWGYKTLGDDNGSAA